MGNGRDSMGLIISEMGACESFVSRMPLRSETRRKAKARTGTACRAPTNAKCRDDRLVRRGWDDGGGGECCGVIEDDAPAFREFFEVEGEDAGGVVGFAHEVENTDYVGGIGAGEMNLQIGKRQCAHDCAVWIGVMVTIEYGLPASHDATGADEFGLLRFPIARHEGVNIAAIPGGGLHVENGADLGFVGEICRGRDGRARCCCKADCDCYRSE